MIIPAKLSLLHEVIDTHNDSSCYGVDFHPKHPQPKSPMDFGQAFSSIMFSFAGASVFPTIQADMRDRTLFPRAAVFSMISRRELRVNCDNLLLPSVLCLIYLPMSVAGWWLLGDKVAGSVVDSLCDGAVRFLNDNVDRLPPDCLQAKVVIEFLFLLHLVSALPIVLNPPFQFFEEILKIPSGLIDKYL